MVAPATLPKRIRALRRGILEWYEANRRDFPWREARDPFHTLVAEMLVHQTFARKIVPVYIALVEKYPTPEYLAKAPAEDIRGIIRPLGFLYRAERLKAISQRLIRDFGSTVPRSEKELLSLPGVGPYT